LDGYHKGLSVLRDRTAGEGTYWPVCDLKKLRSLARSVLYDIVSAAQEIEEFVESNGAYRHDVLEMTYVHPVSSERIDLLAELRSSQRNRARQVQRESALLQSMLSVSTNVSQTISNIRVQRLVVLLTFISIGIAMWAIILTLKGSP